MKILMGLYDDYEGEIRVNEFDLKEINKTAYLERVGALFQDFTRYEGTIRENIGYGNMGIMENDEDIYKACRCFNLDDLILSEGKGLDTQLGYWFESGKQISYGQWQKIALSRTFIRNADMYLLDEPNAALDVVAEYNTAKLYGSLFKGKIGIIIVHKFNNFIGQANKIVVLKDGQIVEEGFHEKLVGNSEEYNKLFELQCSENI